MIALVLAACSETVPHEELPPEPICMCGRPLDTTVTEVFPIELRPVDVLLAVDPALMPPIAEALPSFLEAVLWGGADARLGLVSTALGDPGTAGELIPLGPDGWWTTADPFVAPEADIPSEPPLGALDATALALDDARRGVAVRVLMAQEADDASVRGAPGFISATHDVEDLEVVLVAPDPAPELDVAFAYAGGERFTPDVDPGVALEALLLSFPGFQRTFPMAGRPRVSTLVVEVADVSGAYLPRFDEGSDWVFDEPSNSVTLLEYLPSPGSTVVIRYTPLE